MTINYDSLPPHMHDVMRLYIEHGIEPGSFLTAVLSNDLMKALGKAVETWIKHGGLAGDAVAA